MTSIRIVLVIVIVSACLMAQEQTINGTLVDNACRLEGMSRDALAKHDKGCLQMGACVKSGYAIVADDSKVYVLDAKSNTLALAEIKKAVRETNMRVTAAGVAKGESFTASTLAIAK